MRDAEPTLLLTRPEAQSVAFLAQCETRLGRRLPVVMSPLLRIEPLGDPPELNRFRTVVATSANGVARLGSRLAGRRVVTVGARTAEAASGFGAEAEPLGESVEAFLENAGRIEGPVLIVRGIHARGNMAEALAARGLTVEEAVLYGQVAVPLSQAARTLLAGTAPVAAPLFSPRTARLLSAYPVRAPTTVLAISEAVAEAWNGPGAITVAEVPEAGAMCELVAEAF